MHIATASAAAPARTYQCQHTAAAINADPCRSLLRLRLAVARVRMRRSHVELHDALPSPSRARMLKNMSCATTHHHAEPAYQAD